MNKKFNLGDTVYMVSEFKEKDKKHRTVSFGKFVIESITNKLNKETEYTLFTMGGVYYTHITETQANKGLFTDYTKAFLYATELLKKFEHK